MLDICRKLRDLLDARERRNGAFLFLMMLTMGLLETIGVASIMPFVSVLSQPEIVQANPYLFAIYEELGFQSTDSFLLFLGAVVFVLVVSSLAFKALTHWAMARYAHMRNHTISTRLLQHYLNRPYSWYLNRNTADLGKSVLSEVGQVTKGVLMPALQAVANAIVAGFLIVLVLAVEPFVALAAVGVLGGAYAIIYWAIRRHLARIGAERVRANRERFQIAQEAMGGIKDVKVAGLEDGYIASFRNPARRFARAQASNQMAGELPQFVLQAIAFGGVLVVLMSLLALRGGDIAAVLPTMAVFALATARLTPALQKTYRAMAQLRFGQPALDALHRDLVDEDVPCKAEAEVVSYRAKPILLRNRLELHGVHYVYPGAERPALDNLTLTIPACTTVGLVGRTGAGKTTLVDVLLGLLEPQQGSIRVDGHAVVGSDVRSWQRSVGYVPQHIFLKDDTVAANIAFGMASNDVRMDQVERAARLADLHEFVVGEMRDGYATVIGERGVRLSGGQRQRIGIARALYSDPDVLVLDEATSALDNRTEAAVMSAINNLSQRKTIILIAHRLATVQRCDDILVLERGRIVDSGTYAELSAGSEHFKTVTALRS